MPFLQIMINCFFWVILTEQSMEDFCLICNCKNIIKHKTLYKNPENSKCMDLIITNTPKKFRNSQAIETGTPDFQNMYLTVLKVFHTKQELHIIHYQSYKKFSNGAFINDLQNNFFQFSSSWENCSFKKFKKKNVNITLNKHTPLEKRCVRAYLSPLSQL